MGVWIGLAVTAVSAIAGSISKRKERAKQEKRDKEELEQGRINARKGALLKSDLAEYNEIRELQDRQAAAKDYSSMSSLQTWAPSYTNTTPPVVLPARPTGE